MPAGAPAPTLAELHVARREIWTPTSLVETARLDPQTGVTLTRHVAGIVRESADGPSAAASA